MYAGTLYRCVMTDKQIATRVSEERAKELKVRAAMRDITLADWLREAIDEKLAREGEEGNSLTVAQVAD